MNERTHFFIKIYLSHFILERVDVGCVWEMSWRQGQTAILTPNSSSTIAALLSNFGWVAQPWATEGRKPLVYKLILTQAFCLQLTQTVCALVILLFNTHLLPLFFRLFTQVHLLIDGSVKGQYIRYQCTLNLCYCHKLSKIPLITQLDMFPLNNDDSCDKDKLKFQPALDHKGKK